MQIRRYGMSTQSHTGQKLYLEKPVACSVAFFTLYTHCVYPRYQSGPYRKEYLDLDQ